MSNVLRGLKQDSFMYWLGVASPILILWATYVLLLLEERVGLAMDIAYFMLIPLAAAAGVLALFAARAATGPRRYVAIVAAACNFILAVGGGWLVFMIATTPPIP